MQRCVLRLQVKPTSALQASAAGTESSCSQLQAKATFPLAKEQSGQIGFLSLHFNKPNVARPLQAAPLDEIKTKHIYFFQTLQLCCLFSSVLMAGCK